MAVRSTPSRAEAERYRRAGLWTDELIDGFVAVRAADPATAALPAVVDGPRTVTYGELEQQVRAVAAALHGMGVGRGDVVSWQLPNWWEAVPLHHAILRLGAVSNPVVPIHRRREVEFVLRQAETKVFVHPGSSAASTTSRWWPSWRPRCPRWRTPSSCGARPGPVPRSRTCCAPPVRPRSSGRQPTRPS
ncbi:AMP-binding protein [Pseudonocardia benzenivorans]